MTDMYTGHIYKYTLSQRQRMQPNKEGPHKHTLGKPISYTPGLTWTRQTDGRLYGDTHIYML